MQSAALTSTMPSWSTTLAPVGQTRTQGGVSPCMHWPGSIWTEPAGYRPRSVCRTQLRLRPRGTAFSALHATMQASQSRQAASSITIAKRLPLMSGLLHGDEGLVQRRVARDAIEPRDDEVLIACPAALRVAQRG